LLVAGKPLNIAGDLTIAFVPTTAFAILSSTDRYPAHGESRRTARNAEPVDPTGDTAIDGRTPSVEQIEAQIAESAPDIKCSFACCDALAV
jgi:hypothetical protein